MAVQRKLDFTCAFIRTTNAQIPMGSPTQQQPLVSGMMFRIAAATANPCPVNRFIFKPATMLRMPTVLAETGYRSHSSI